MRRKRKINYYPVSYGLTVRGRKYRNLKKYLEGLNGRPLMDSHRFVETDTNAKELLDHLKAIDSNDRVPIVSFPSRARRVFYFAKQNLLSDLDDFDLT